MTPECLPEENQAPPSLCPGCGQPLPKTAITTAKCEACLHRGYMVMILEQEAQVRPADNRIWVALHGATRSSHLALAVDPALAYCGLRLAQARTKRRTVDRTKPLEGICGQCILALFDVEKQRAAARGGSS